MASRKSFLGRDIIDINDFSRQDLEWIIQQAKTVKKLDEDGVRILDYLQGKTVGLCFWENSTRTRTSFEQAVYELNGHTFGFSGKEGTSLMKKENILATLKMYEAYHGCAFVMRHPLDGAPQWAADILNVPVINGGDGANQHPTQTILDLMTLDELRPGIDGLTLGLGGDLQYGRTVRFLVTALAKFENITIYWAAPNELALPKDLEKLMEERGHKIVRCDKVEEVTNNVDVLYQTRPQKERITSLTGSQVDELIKDYLLTPEKLENAKCKVMHPLPVDSTVAEIDIGVFYLENQHFFTQAENGLFSRKALLKAVIPQEYQRFNPTLSTELREPRNYLHRELSNSPKGDLHMKHIQYGMVIDHLPVGKAEEILARLDLRDYSVLNNKKGGHGPKDLLKVERPLTHRQIKEIAIIANGECTFAEIRDSQVADKWLYHLCSNGNCITRKITEDVDPRFINQGGKPICRYCRKEQPITHAKVSESSLAQYINSLPTEIRPL